ncbi:MAG TPA: hypothetical protein ENN63_03865 [Bacteroidetes bacterium]|nr:hypothetical protein [Bacteroidota bacterium]
MKFKAAYILKYRRWIILTAVLFSLVSAWFIPRLTLNPDVFSNLPEDDEVAAFFNQVGEEYGGNYNCIIGLESRNVFTEETLQEIITIQDSIRYMDGVGHITSLVNVLDIRSSEWGIEIGKLVDEYAPPSTEEELHRLREYTLSKDMYRGRLVSEDATMTILAVRLENDAAKIDVANRIREKVQSMPLTSKVHFGGQPFIIAAFGDSINRDLIYLGPLALALILLVLYLGFRNTRGVLLPVLTVLLSILWTFGTMGILNIEISIISSVIPILLIAVGSAYTIHVLNRINETPEADEEKRLEQAWGYIAVPVIFTALTTMFGFISFVFGSYLHLIKIFGLFTSAGIFFALLVSLFLIPGMAELKRSPGISGLPGKNGLLASLLKKTSDLVIHHPRRVILFWGSLILLFAIGAFHIQRKVDFLEYFRKKDPNRITENILKEKMGGTFPVYISVKGDILDPEVMQAIFKTQQVMKEDPNLVYTQSVADLVASMNEAMGEGKLIPDERDRIENLWFLIEGQDILEQLINENKQEAIIQGMFNSSEIDDARRFIDFMESYFDSMNSSQMEFKLTGYPSLVIRLDESLVSSQIRSLAIALMLVLLAVSLLQRSLLRGILSVFPIITTLVILFGCMGWSGIPLDIATVLVGSISIGIGVDYAIHISNHFSHAMRNGHGLTKAIEHSVGISGKAIVINMFSVTAGFLVLLFSSLIPLARFGILVGITMLASGSASLTLLPALLLSNHKLGEKFKPKNHENHESNL